jgi:hypothetical protein
LDDGIDRMCRVEIAASAVALDRSSRSVGQPALSARSCYSSRRRPSTRLSESSCVPVVMESVNECVAIECTGKQERRHNEVHLSCERSSILGPNERTIATTCASLDFSMRSAPGIDTLVSSIPSCNGLGFQHVVQSPVRHSPTNDAFAEGESRSASSPGGCDDADTARDEFN